MTPEQQSEAGLAWSVFPNTSILQGITFALCYRTRPYGDDPNYCIFESYALERFPDEASLEDIYVRLEDPFGHAVLKPDPAAPLKGLGKIAALGIKVSNHCTYHGVALNVAMDLKPFQRIDPCGYRGLVTVDLAGLGVRCTWSDVAGRLVASLSRRL